MINVEINGSLSFDVYKPQMKYTFDSTAKYRLHLPILSFNSIRLLKVSKFLYLKCPCFYLWQSPFSAWLKGQGITVVPSRKWSTVTGPEWIYRWEMEHRPGRQGYHRHTPPAHCVTEWQVRVRKKAVDRTGEGTGKAAKPYSLLPEAWVTLLWSS